MYNLHAVAVSGVYGALPQGCSPLEDRPLSMTNPADIFGTNSELNQKSRPHRTGNLRSRGALPTHHFARNEIIEHPVPMILFPYEGIFILFI